MFIENKNKILHKKWMLLGMVSFLIFLFSTSVTHANPFDLLPFISLNEFLYSYVLSPIAHGLAVVAEMANHFMIMDRIVTSPIVRMGWQITRDLANMFFILILLGIALDFILFNSFGVKKALPTLFLVALLINFSLPLAGVLIDFSHVFANFFMSQIAAEGGKGFTEAIAHNLDMARAFEASGQLENIKEAASGMTINIMFMIVFMAGTALVFLALGIMFFIRTLYLAVLLIVLPIVLVLWAFPPTSGHFKKWGNKFMQWTMFAPIAAFFLYLSMLILNASKAISVPGNRVQFTEQAITYITAWALLLGAIAAGQSMGAPMGKIIMNMPGGVGRWARGKVGKGATKWAGESVRKGAEKTKVADAMDWTGRLFGKIPLIGRAGQRGMAKGALGLRSAKLQEAEMLKSEKDMMAGGFDDQISGYIVNLQKGTWAEQSRAAKMIAAAGDDFKIRDKKGNFDSDATRDAKRAAATRANLIKDYDTRNKINNSDFDLARERINIKYGYNSDGSEKPDGKYNITVDRDTGKSLDESRKRKMEQLLRGVNLGSETWDDNIVRDDENFTASLVEYGALNGEKMKRAQRAGNTETAKQLKILLRTGSKETIKHLMHEKNASLRTFLKNSSASGLVLGDDFKMSSAVKQALGIYDAEQRGGEAKMLKELRKGASKKDKTDIKDMYTKDFK